jgi:transcriptional regulator with XRE-family HTH domain
MSQEYLRAFGQAVRSVREEHGFTVSQLAEVTGVDEAQILALENGRLDADLDLIVALSRGLGTGLAAFFTRAEELGFYKN